MPRVIKSPKRKKKLPAEASESEASIDDEEFSDKEEIDENQDQMDLESKG